MFADVLISHATKQPEKRDVKVTLEDSFPKQWDYVSTTERFPVVVCSRRAGKSAGVVRRAAKTALEKPQSRQLYITLGRRNARKLFYEPLRVLLEEKGIAHSHNDQDLSIRLRNGSYIEAGSCLDVDDVDKFRGDQWDRIYLDEAQSFRPAVARQLVNQALLASLADRRGSLEMLGTPPPAGPVGYFYETYAAGRFARFKWTLFDNPYIPSDSIKELIEARGLTEEHPIYKREFLGEFIVDYDSLVFEFLAERNEYDVLPVSSAWRYSMGVDIGLNDRDAFVVAGWRTDDPRHELHVVYEWQKDHQDIEAFNKKFLEVYHQYRPAVTVMDSGGGGAKMRETLRPRLGNVVFKEKPSSVADSIGLVNDDLRTGRMRFPRGGHCSNDALLVTWEEGALKKTVSDAYHSDIMDALRYAHHGATHYRGKAPPKEPTLQELREKKRLERLRRIADPYGD